MSLHPGFVQKDKVHSYSLSSTENKRETGSTVSNSSGLDLPFLSLFFFFFPFLKYSPHSLPSASLLLCSFLGDKSVLPLLDIPTGKLLSQVTAGVTSNCLRSPEATSLDPREESYKKVSNGIF